jgi:5-methylcytosine-specific restriction endonuclease McrA
MRLCRAGLHDLDDEDNVYVTPSTNLRGCHPCKKQRARERNRRDAERLNAEGRCRYDRTREARRITVAKWERSNPDKRIEYRHRHRALKALAVSEPYMLSEVIAKTESLCHLCGKEVDLDLTGRDQPMRKSVDHIVPLSKGGDDTLANVALTHFRCNSAKGNRSVPSLLLAVA